MTDRIVTTDIPLGDPGRGAYAFRIGDKVSEADVKANGWEGYVASSTSKAGQQATASASGEATTSEKRG